MSNVAMFDEAIAERKARLAELENEAQQPAEPEQVFFAKDTAVSDTVEPVLDVLNRHGEHAGIAVYGSRFVRPKRVNGKRWYDDKKQPVETIEFVPFGAADFQYALSKCIQFIRKSLTRGGKVRTDRTDAPISVVNALLRMADECSSLHIERNALTPIVRGTRLYAESGHNRDLCAWIQSPHIELPATIDKAAATDALTTLRDWLSEFPFASEQDESAGLSAVLTAAMRASLDHAPGFLVSKPDFGAGASTLCNFVHIVLAGNHAPVANGESDSAELTKFIDAAQMAALPAVCIDNVRRGGSLNNVALAQLITEPARQTRVLGVSELRTFPNSQMILANGNNVGVHSDLVRRFVGVQFRGVANAAAREFRRPNLLSDAINERADLLAACYTIVLAYRQNGEHIQTARISFDEWSQACAAPLVWLGLPDPTLGQERLRTEDDEATFHRELLHAWHAAHGNRKVTVKDLVRTRPGNTESEEWAVTNEVGELLRDQNNGRDDTRAFGKLIAAFRDVTLDGMTIVAAGTFQRAAVWQLVGKPPIDDDEDTAWPDGDLR